MPKYAFFRGGIVPNEQACVNIATHALNYGTGCFEGIRAYWNQDHEQLYVFRLAEHFERMHRSCRILRIELLYTVDELNALTLELLRKEGYRQDAYIRPLAYKADEIIGVRLHDLHDEFAMFAVPFGRYIEKEEGAHVCISAWRRVDDNATPARAKITGAYINSALVKSDAVLSGYLGDAPAVWEAYDSYALIEAGAHLPEILVDQGTADGFLDEQLRPHLLEEACRSAGIDLTLRMQTGYDHSYYFISTFMAVHLAWHARRLKA